jgi:hypothetical protein
MPYREVIAVFTEILTKKKKSKFVPVHAMQAYRGRQGEEQYNSIHS